MKLEVWYIINVRNDSAALCRKGIMTMRVFKRSISLIMAILPLVLCMAALMAAQTPVRAARDSNYTWVEDEKDLKEAVNDLPTASSPNADQIAEIQAVAARLSHLTDKAKRNVSSSVIRQLAKLYNRAVGINNDGEDEVDLGDDDDSSSKRIEEDDSIAYGVSAANGSLSMSRLQIDQHKSSGSVLLKMDLDGFDGPVYVDLALHGKPFSTSRDYYFKVDGKSTRLNASVSTSGGSNHIKFIAPEEGEYKLYQEGSSNSSNSNSSYDYDDLDSFWQGVVDDIESAASGTRVRVNLGSRTSMPTDVLRALKNSTVTLALTESNGNIISIYGKDVKVPSGSTVSVSTLRSTYDKNTAPSSSSAALSSSSAAASGSSSGGLPVSPLPGGIGGGTSGGVTAVGGTGTPNAGGGPTSPIQTSPLPTNKLPGSTLPVSPLPTLPTDIASSSSQPSSSETESSSTASFASEFRDESSPEAENVAVREPMDLPEMPAMAGEDSRIGRVVNQVGLAGVLAFIGLAVITAALGGGLLTYAILRRRADK